jgi:hypothetical protein
MAKQYFNRDEVIFAPHPKVSNFKDLTGQRFEKLTVLGFAGTRNNDGKWYCECNCGKIISSCGYSIKSGNTKSCGGYVIAVLFLSRREKEFFATMRIKSISMGANCSQIWEV